MQIIRNSLLGTVRQSKVLNTKNFECSPGFMFLVTYGAIFLQLSRFRLLSTWGLRRARARCAAWRFIGSKRLHFQADVLQKWQRCSQADSPVNAYVFFSVTKKHLYLTITHNIQRISV